jgi:hypothetical protein
MSNTAGEGHGVYGGTALVTVGSHVLDARSGVQGTVEQIVGPHHVFIRLPDGTLARAEVPH